MLTPISTKIEEFEKKFVLKTFAGQELENPQIRPSVTPEQAKDFIFTALEQRDKEWRELVGYVRESAESCAVLARENESNNIRNNIIRPLNDIITKSKENN